MNLIGQKIAQCSRILSNAQFAAGGLNTQREISNKAGRLSNCFIQAASPQAIKGITPGGTTFSRMKPTISKVNFVQTHSFSSKTGGTQTPKFNFLEGEDLAPIKRIYTALKEFSARFKDKGITAKEVERFGATCYNLQVATDGDELSMVKSWVHSSLVQFFDEIERTTRIAKDASPEEIKALNELTALKKETFEFLMNYKRA
jgi:hypothetical protein